MMFFEGGQIFRPGIIISRTLALRNSGEGLLSCIIARFITPRSSVVVPSHFRKQGHHSKADEDVTWT